MGSAHKSPYLYITLLANGVLNGVPAGVRRNVSCSTCVDLQKFDFLGDFRTHSVGVDVQSC